MPTSTSRPNRRLLQLLQIIAVLNVLHIVDHLFRGDFHWPIDAQSISFLIVVVVIFGGLALGSWLYCTGLVGARFWFIIGWLGLGLGWLSHFSPFTDQPVAHIYHAYASAWAGLLAVGCLIMIMVTVLAATIHAGYLWLATPRE